MITRKVAGCLGWVLLIAGLATPALAVDTQRASTSVDAGATGPNVGSAFAGVWNEGPYDCTQTFSAQNPQDLLITKLTAPGLNQAYGLGFEIPGGLSQALGLTFELEFNPTSNALEGRFGTCDDSVNGCVCSDNPIDCPVPATNPDGDICPGLCILNSCTTPGGPPFCNLDSECPDLGVCEAPSLAPIFGQTIFGEILVGGTPIGAPSEGSGGGGGVGLPSLDSRGAAALVLGLLVLGVIWIYRRLG